MPTKGNSKYPWDAWTARLKDGQAWKVTRFVDYTCESASFGSQVYLEASRRGMKATVVVFPEFVLFVFFAGDSYWKPNLRAYPEVRKLRSRYGYTV